ncbi:MAG: hypothetical protein RMJ67_01295 [Elusimicrobiota bacterium]|nr:hypothetical protein [Endomicrobiia bacterium]MDW8165139.1 hypothetical protein [Elusimicrobiota bacterium]
MIFYLKNSILFIIDYAKIPSRSFIYKLYALLTSIVDFVFSYKKNFYDIYIHKYLDDFGNLNFEVVVASYTANTLPIERFLNLFIEKTFSHDDYFYLLSIEKEYKHFFDFQFIKNAQKEIRNYFKYLIFTDQNQIVHSSKIKKKLQDIINDITKVINLSNVYFDIQEYRKDTILIGISYLLNGKKKTFLFKIRKIS